MKNKGLLTFIVVIIILVAAVYLFLLNDKPTEENINNNVNVQTDDTSVFNPDLEESDDPTVEEFTLSATNFAYDQTEIRVPLGSTVRLTLNVEEGFHDWMVDEFDAATTQMQAGNNETIEFVVDQAGTFEYYCSVGEHRQMGMVGKLIVE